VKIIALIFSFYILALNVLPCNDTNVSTDNQQIEVAFNTDLEHSHTAFDLCPPFCTCHCCHVHTIDFGSSNFEPLISEISSEVLGHSDNLGQDISISLLQPPKV